MSKGLYGKFEDCKKEEEWLPVSFDLETCSWQKQELYKGRKSLLGILGTTDWSGWGFNESLPNVKVWDEADANAVTDMNIFKTNTVFKLNPVSITNSVATRIETDRHLAMGIPALSPATGRTNLETGQISKWEV